MKERDPQILDFEAIIKAKAGSKAKYIPKFIINWFRNYAHEDYINGFLKEGYVGVEFCEKGMEYLGVNIEVEGLENLPDDGRKYTFASNHPLGAIDGVTLGMVLGRKYDGKIKYLMNDIVMFLKGMAPMGIPVNKIGNQSRELSKLMNEAYESDSQMIIFPAGLCSRMIDGKIQDIEWGKSFITKSRQTGRDIVPVHFEGRNSDRFYKVATWCKRLNLFNFAMLMLPDEMYRCAGKTYKVKIGKPIPISSFDRSKLDIEWAKEVRELVYKL